MMLKAKFKDNVHLWGSGSEQMRGVECIILDTIDISYYVQYWISNIECTATIPQEYVELLEEEKPKYEPVVEEKVELETPKPRLKETTKESESKSPIRKTSSAGSYNRKQN